MRITPVTKAIMQSRRRQTMSKKEEFLDWIDQCPDNVYVYHEDTNDDDDNLIYVYGFSVPKEQDDE